MPRLGVRGPEDLARGRIFDPAGMAPERLVVFRLGTCILERRIDCFHFALTDEAKIIGIPKQIDRWHARLLRLAGRGSDLQRDGMMLMEALAAVNTAVETFWQFLN